MTAAPASAAGVCRPWLKSMRRRRRSKRRIRSSKNPTRAETVGNLLPGERRRFCSLNLWRGGKRQELLAADEDVLVRVAQVEPFLRLLGFSHARKLGEAEEAIFVEIERLEFRGPRVPACPHT